MATLQEVTASNQPVVSNPNELEEELENWEFSPGAFDDLTVNVREFAEGDGHYLNLHGYCGFHPVHKSDISEDELGTPIEESDHEQFLKAIVDHLDEPLIVQQIGHEKCRFPLGASGWTVTTDGDVTYHRIPNKVEHEPNNNPSSSSEAEA